MSDSDIGETIDGPQPSVRPVRKAPRARPPTPWRSPPEPVMRVVPPAGTLPRLYDLAEQRTDPERQYYCPLCGLRIDAVYGREFMTYERAMAIDGHLAEGCVVFEVLKKHLSEKT